MDSDHLEPVKDSNDSEEKILNVAKKRKSKSFDIINNKRPAVESDDEAHEKRRAELNIRNFRYNNKSEDFKEERKRREREKYQNEKKERNCRRRERLHNRSEEERKAEKEMRNEKNKRINLSNPDSIKFRKLKTYSALNRHDYLFNGESTYFKRFEIGHRTEKCSKCGAMHYNKNPEMKPRGNKSKEKSFDICCKEGEISLPQLDCPELLKSLFNGSHPESENFIQNIQQFNNSLSLASVGYRKFNTEQKQIKHPGSFCIKTECGSNFTYALLREPNYKSPQYNMVWFLDTEKTEENQVINEKFKIKLFKTLKEHNPLFQRFEYIYPKFQYKYKVALEEEEKEEEANAEVKKSSSSTAVALYGDNDTDNTDRGIVCVPKQNSTQKTPGTDAPISPEFSYTKQIIPKYNEYSGYRHNFYYYENNSICDLLAYPLLFPSGDKEWYDKDSKPNKVTHFEFYRYMIAHRPNIFSPMRFAGKLFSQYLVDSFIKAEANRAHFHRKYKSIDRKDTIENIKKFESEFEDVHENVPNVGSLHNRLSASFTGSPRYLQERYLDVMAIVAKYGEFDLSITFACNPDWPEFDSISKYRVDDICDVFKIKAMQLIADVEKDQIFGRVLAHVAVIEFPKGDLPQLHMLVTLHDDDKPRTAEVVDKMISAELPRPRVEKLLYEKVCKYMLHKKCSNYSKAACMDKWGNCTSGFPKMSSNKTYFDDEIQIYKRTEDDYYYDHNTFPSTYCSWVIPYNWLLLLKYDAHISVELCQGKGNVIKWLFDKYHPSRAIVDIKSCETDEKVLRLNYRCIGPYEAYWRIMKYKTNFLSNSVKRLELHCKDKQTVYFKEHEHKKAVEEERVSTLMAWFQLNKDHFEESGKYLYLEIPEHYIFEKGEWKKRKNKSSSIGRMYSPKLGSEEYYLRIMLFNVPGASGFEDLKTVDNYIHPTFKDAAFAAGILNDDPEYSLCLEQAVEYIKLLLSKEKKSKRKAEIRGLYAKQIRSIFAYFLALGSPKAPKILYDNYADYIKADFSKLYPDDESAPSELVWRYIKRITGNLGLAESDLKSMLEFNIEQSINVVEEDEDEKYLDSLLKEGEEMKLTLKGEQIKIANDILDAVLNNNDQRLFFVDGPAGSGKTYLFTTIYNILVGKRKKVHCVSWSGVSGTLLPKGRTVHSLFKLPVPLTKDSYISQIIAQSSNAEELRKADVFIWDEVSMASKYALKSVDQLLRDVTNNRDLSFGGKFIITGGDFRQILPIVLNGGDPLKETFKMDTKRWNWFKEYSLVENLRIGDSDDAEANEFKELVLNIGESANFVDILNKFQVSNLENLVDFVFSDFEQIESKAIVTTTNQKSLQINQTVLEKMEGQQYSFVSKDSCESMTGHINKELENKFLEKMRRQIPDGYPPYELTLKKGAIVMLLRNLDVTNGLTNGTRLIVRDFGDDEQEDCYILICEIASGNSRNIGRRVFIPRIAIINRNDNTGLPYYLCRKQFPLRLAFCMTINKSQGQTFKKLGVYLGSGIYSHGQLYVAVSRVEHPNNLKIHAPNGKIKNVVNREVLFRDVSDNDDDD